MKALATRPDLRAAQQGVTAANSQYLLAKANGKRDVTAQINYTHVADVSTASLFGQIQLPIFDRNQGEIARTQFAITQAQEQEKFTSDQVLTDVKDAYEGLRTNDQVDSALPLGLPRRGAAGSRHQRIRLQARRRELAGLSGCRAKLSRDTAGLPAGARVVLALARAASRSGGNEDTAMNTSQGQHAAHARSAPLPQGSRSPARSRDAARAGARTK